MRRLRVLGVAFLMIALSAGTTYSDFIDHMEQWFSDGTFTTVVGFYEKDCGGVITQWGTTSDWRRQDNTGCNTGNNRHTCWHWNGASWDEIPCP